MEKRYYTYMLLCSNNAYYTGYTVDLVRRYKQHRDGIGGKYTRSYRPRDIVYVHEFDTRHEAMSWEAQIKQMSRAQKEELLNTPFNIAYSFKLEHGELFIW